MPTTSSLLNTSGDSLRNHFLVAMPGLNDPLFANSITYICDHSPEGAMGLVVNRTMELHMSDVFEQMTLTYKEEQGQAPILAGGPVNIQRGFVLHPTGSIWQSTVQITADISLTSSRDIIAAIAAGHGPENALFILGYSGWSAGQLEMELKQKAWVVKPAEPDVLALERSGELWTGFMRRLGPYFRLMAAAPEDPSLN